MVSALIVNENTYGTRAEATTYLNDSPRTSAGWTATPSSKKDQSLLAATRELEKFKYQGAKTGLNVIGTVAVNVGGSGYAVGDVLTVSTGTGVPALVSVLTLAATAVATVQLIDAGLYSVDPDATSATTSSSVGSGCTLDLTLKSQVLSFPRTGLKNLEGEAVDPDTVPEIVKFAEFELAYLISQDVSIEGSFSTSGNLKRMKAGSVEIERFKPTEGTRLPNVVFELLRTFLEGYAALTRAFSSGTDVESQFDVDDTYSVTDGFP